MTEMIALSDILTALLHPIRLFKEKTRFLLSSVQGEKENTLRCHSAIVKKTKIKFKGKDNDICLDGCEIYNCDIFLRGNGHKLILEKDVKLYNMRIKIIGNRNTLHIESGTSIADGNIIGGGVSIPIHIGRKCMIAEGVDIWSTDTHSIFEDGNLVNPPQPIHIGNHVWIGKDVAILKGVTIGDDAIIGMKSMVTHDVQANSLNVGSPAKQIREKVSWAKINPNNKS